MPKIPSHPVNLNYILNSHFTRIYVFAMPRIRSHPVSLN